MAHHLIDSYMTWCPVTVDHHQSIAEARELMASARVRHLPVMAEGAVIGILSEKDVYRFLAEKPVEPESAAVSEAMSPEPYLVPVGSSVHDVAASMAERHCDITLVTEAGRLMGVFTQSDGLHLLAEILNDI